MFQARSLRLALRAGEPRRIVRALAMEAAHVACAGQAVRRRTAKLLRAAEAATGRAAEPYTEGILSLARGIVAYLEGRWNEARRFGESAEATFRDHCTGAAWEIDTARIFSLWSLNFLGEIAELRRRWMEWMKDAKERGDMYMTGTLGTLMMALVRIADDEPDSGQRELLQVAQRLVASGLSRPAPQSRPGELPPESLSRRQRGCVGPARAPPAQLCGVAPAQGPDDPDRAGTVSGPGGAGGVRCCPRSRAMLSGSGACRAET